MGLAHWDGSALAELCGAEAGMAGGPLQVSIDVLWQRYVGPRAGKAGGLEGKEKVPWHRDVEPCAAVKVKMP